MTSWARKFRITPITAVAALKMATRGKEITNIELYPVTASASVAWERYLDKCMPIGYGETWSRR